MFIIYPDCLVTFTLTYMYILYYLDYLAPMHIDSVLVLLVNSLVIVLLFRKYFLTVGNGLVIKPLTVVSVYVTNTIRFI